MYIKQKTQIFFPKTKCFFEISFATNEQPEVKRFKSGALKTIANTTKSMIN